MKKGSLIRRIVLGLDGIAIHDVKELLAPSASLGRFASMAGLDIKKLCFPFGLFDSKLFLERTEFPANREEWIDGLSQKTPSQAEVDAVIKEYKKGKFKNIGAYLSHYLAGEWAPTVRPESNSLNPFLARSGHSVNRALVREIHDDNARHNRIPPDRHAQNDDKLLRLQPGPIGAHERTETGSLLTRFEGHVQCHIFLQFRRSLFCRVSLFVMRG